MQQEPPSREVEPSNNPYAAPSAPVRDPVDTRPIPEFLLAPIRHATIAGYFVTAVTAIMVVVGVYVTQQPQAWYGVVDVAISGGLSFGIQRRSRVCAFTMLAYLILSQIINMVTTGMPTGIMVGLVIAYYLYKGAMATVEYHRYLRDRDNYARPRSM